MKVDRRILWEETEAFVAALARRLAQELPESAAVEIDAYVLGVLRRARQERKR